MKEAEDRGGSRALLRHALSQIPSTTDHVVVLGDFNSQISSREISSWHCFYGLSGSQQPSSSAERRGSRHFPLWPVKPTNSAVVGGTYFWKDSGGAELRQIDFIAIDKGLRNAATSENLVAVNSQSVFDVLTSRPIVSDHLPVGGSVNL